MFEAINAFLQQVTGSINPANPAGMAATYGVSLFVEIGLPIPFVIETLLFFSSYNVGPLSLQVFSIAAMSLAGRETGAAVLYWLSRRLGPSFLRRLQKVFPSIRCREERLKKRLQGKVTYTVIAVRLTPGLIQMPSVLGGSMHIDYSGFAVGVALSSLVYDFIVVGLGTAAAMGLQGVSSDLKTYVIISLIVLLVFLWGFFFFMMQRRQPD